MKKSLPTLVLFTLLATGTAWAQPPGESREHHPRGHYLLHERVAGKLDLSDEQRASIRQLVEDHRAEYAPNREARADHKAVYKALLDAPEFDEAAARELLEAKTEQRLAHLKLQHQIRQVLTDEQRRQLDKMHKRIKRKHH